MTCTHGGHLVRSKPFERALFNAVAMATPKALAGIDGLSRRMVGKLRSGTIRNQCNDGWVPLSTLATLLRTSEKDVLVAVAASLRTDGEWYFQRQIW